MTKEELKRYLDERDIPEIWAFPGFPNYDSVHYDNIKDAIQIEYEHREMLHDIILGTGCFRTSYGTLSDGHIIVFDDHIEVYPRDETIPPMSSNDQTSIGSKLKIAHDAFKTMPRVKGMPEHVRFFANEHSDDWKNSYLKEKLDDCVDYMKSIGFEWVDELCSIVYSDQSNNKQADSDKVQPQSDAVLNASDGYIVIDTPVKIFRSQAAMESYRREHKEENTPALFVKDGEILCLQETKPQEETKPTIDDVMKKETGVNFWRVCKASGKR